MLFSSAIFIVLFLPVFLLCYLISPQRWRNHVALVFSFIFYTWGAPEFSILLFASGISDYLLSFKLLRDRAMIWLWIGIGYNVLTLAVFKYFNFFIENVEFLATSLGLEFPSYMSIVLPIGVSFFTFQKMSYLVDVYRGDSPRARNVIDYLLFVYLFPQLIAGPIVRYKDIADQISDRNTSETWSNRLGGFYRFCVGLARKVLIADSLAPLVDAVFASEELGAWSAIVGVVAYAMQIYFDFGGYSDMAIGLGQMMGFRFPENFNWPYLAKGFREFWHRWHITLGAWMRDYLYIPLGGNKASQARTIINLWLVFLLSGLWHGASWNFVIWGAWHGLFISVDRYTSVFRKLPKIIGVMLTFALVTLGWIWFRADTVHDALAYFGSLIDWDGVDIDFTSKQRTVLVISMVIAMLPQQLSAKALNWYRTENSSSDIWKTFISIALLFLCLGQLAIVKNYPFIYFKF
ncbi:MAG: MBOAT family protein [Flavobacteriales bacterium]